MSTLSRERKIISIRQWSAGPSARIINATRRSLFQKTMYAQHNSYAELTW